MGLFEAEVAEQLAQLIERTPGAETIGDVERITGKSLDWIICRAIVGAAEEQAVADGEVIEVDGVRWAVGGSVVALAEAGGNELMAARLRRALARLQRKGKEPG